MSYCHCIITRFSYRFRSTDPIEPLLSDARLERRIQLHEQFCYSSIINQNNPNFYWILIIDPLLPPKYRDQLQELIDRHYQSSIYKKKGPRRIWLHTWDWETNNLGKLDWILPYFENEKEKLAYRQPKYFITTRLDDDDSLHENFINMVKQQLNKRPYIRGFRYLSFASGFYFYCQKQNLRNTTLPMIALGLTLITELEKYPICVYMGSHTKIPQYIKDPNRHDLMLKYYKRNKDLPVSQNQIRDRLKVIRGVRTWVRNVHDFNLQKNIRKHYARKQDLKKIQAILKTNFHIEFNS